MSVPFTWLDKVDARVRVVDCMCKVCATHVTSNMHPAAACRDSCENPILVKSSWISDWFPLGSLDTCVNCDSNLFRQWVPASVRLFKMLRHIISKVIFFLIGAVLALTSIVLLLKCCS